MTALSDDTKLTLAGYLPRDGGYEIPGTHGGNVFEYACWNWVLSAGNLSENNDRSYPSIQRDLIQINPNDENGIFATGVREEHRKIYLVEDDLKTMREQLEGARTQRKTETKRFTRPQTRFLSAFVRAMLRANGLVPSGDSGPYVVVVKSSDWWSTDHWAIGIDLPPDNHRMYVQTLPNMAVYHNCDHVCSKELPEVVVGITSLLPAHVTFLEKVPKAPCRVVECQSVKNTSEKWHQCTKCGAIYCPVHAEKLSDRGDQTRTCGPRCRGSTRLW